MEKGEIIQLEFEGWISGTEELFDTTDEDLAREHEIHDEERTYGPVYTVVGVGRLVKGLDDHILQADLEKEYEVEIPPEEGYGERDPKNVETHSMREMTRLKVEPEIGKEVVIRNRQGWISGIFAGRVRIDFNHKLAGKTLRYHYKISGRAETPEEKARAIIAMDYGREDEFEIELEDEGEVTLTLPDVCKYDPNWTLSKLRLVNDLREHAAMSTVVMREVYVKKEAAEEEAAEEGAAEGAEGEAAPEAEEEAPVEEEAEEEPAEETEESEEERPE